MRRYPAANLGSQFYCASIEEVGKAPKSATDSPSKQRGLSRLMGSVLLGSVVAHPCNAVLPEFSAPLMRCSIRDDEAARLAASCYDPA